MNKDNLYFDKDDLHFQVIKTLQANKVYCNGLVVKEVDKLVAAIAKLIEEGKTFVKELEECPAK